MEVTNKNLPENFALCEKLENGEKFTIFQKQDSEKYRVYVFINGKPIKKYTLGIIKVSMRYFGIAKGGKS